jgi:hypothetical protein
MITGLGIHSYIHGLRALVGLINKKAGQQEKGI